MQSVPLLSLAIWIPILFGVAVLRLGSDRHPQRTRWLALVDLVLKKDDDWRQQIDARSGFPAGKSKADKAQLGPAREAHLQLIAELAAQEGLLDLLQRLRSLPAAAYEDAQWEVLQALLDVLKLAAAQLRVVFAARGVVDFAEVATQAVAALGSDEAPTELALAFDYRIRHLLVDEFQDTNPMQSALVDLLAGEHRNLMVVGDDDQSIYGWRGATLKNILDFKARYPEAQEITLIENYRSTASILDTAYRLIQHNNPERLEVINQLDKRLHAQTNDGPEPIARHFYSLEAELTWIADDIAHRLLVHRIIAHVHRSLILFRSNW